MYKSLRILVIFFLSTGLSVTCYSSIAKLANNKFRIINSEGKVKDVEIDGVSGFIDYFAEVYHTSQNCSGCTAYLYSIAGDSYYLYYERHLPHTDLVSKFLSSYSQISNPPSLGVVLFEPGLSSSDSITMAAIGNVKMDQPQQPRTMVSSRVFALERISDQDLHFELHSDGSSTLSQISGDYTIVDQASFKD